MVFFLDFAGLYKWIKAVGTMMLICGYRAHDAGPVFRAVMGTVILKGLLLGIVKEGSAPGIMN
jgi:hypothetical protein